MANNEPNPNAEYDSDTGRPDSMDTEETDMNSAENSVRTGGRSPDSTRSDSGDGSSGGGGGHGTDSALPSDSPELTALATPLFRGAYTGFVEWRSPPPAGQRHWTWFLGFFAGFAVKLALILYVGAEFIPT